MERGLLYMTGDGTPSALSDAGYLRPDQMRGRVLDALPEPPEVSNPVVRTALHELRKIVNNIIRRYGKPAHIHLELARNASASSEERKKMSQHMREREAERDHAADKIREYGIKVNREGIDRYLLWQEQGELCVYCGRSISVAQLFGGEVHVDHILPYSRCLDDSFMNKVVCCTNCNNQKANQTPVEWLAMRDPVRFDGVCQRAYRLKYGKRRRFMQKQLDLDKFIERQMNDTRYISRQALDYLRKLFAEPHHVHCPKGSHTETFRWLWGLNTILREDSLNRKNRTDHRHHAIDAVVLALTDQKRLQALSAVQRGDGSAASLAEPWEGFRSDVQRSIEAINVSHRVRRKIAGPLHEDTIYGPTSKPGEFVIRKPIELLTTAMIDQIRDPAIRQIVIDRLKRFGVRHGRGSKATISADVWKAPLTMASGVQIKKVRLIKPEKSIRAIRGGAAHVKPGSIHHACIFEITDASGKKRRDAVYVTMLDAIRRAQSGQPIVQRIHPDFPAAKFIMSLCSGDMLLAEFDGKERLVVVSTLVSTQKRIHIVDANDARRSSDKKDAGKTPSSLVGRKVTVTPLGEIRWAND